MQESTNAPQPGGPRGRRIYIYIYIYIYLKAHSADPPPCQRELQPGWTEVVLSDGSVFLFNFLCGLALEVVRSFGAHLYYIQKLFWKSARGFTACTGGNSAGISASKAWVDTFWIGFANMFCKVLFCILCSAFCFVFEAGIHLQGPPGRGKWSSVASGWPKHRFFMILAPF